MKFTTTEIVRGYQSQKFTIDGKEFETKVLFVDTALNEDQGAKGHRTTEIKCIDASVIDAIKHNPFPMQAELEIEQLATKNKTELFVRNIKPIKAVGMPGAQPVKTTA
jgi:hypothetical protein